MLDCVWLGNNELYLVVLCCVVCRIGVWLGFCWVGLVWGLCRLDVHCLCAGLVVLWLAWLCSAVLGGVIAGWVGLSWLGLGWLVFGKVVFGCAEMA